MHEDRPGHRAIHHHQTQPTDAVSEPHFASAQVCPACAGRLIEIRGKLICSRCRTICETCCDGGRQV